MTTEKLIGKYRETACELTCYEPEESYDGKLKKEAKALQNHPTIQKPK